MCTSSVRYSVESENNVIRYKIILQCSVYTWSWTTVLMLCITEMPRTYTVIADR